VRDVVNALVSLSEHSQAVGKVFNIGSTQEVSILELAKRVRDVTDSDSQIVCVPYDEVFIRGFEDMQRRVPNIRAHPPTDGLATALHAKRHSRKRGGI
jgi:UDP-glucose 4-epimerase